MMTRAFDTLDALTVHVHDLISGDAPTSEIASAMLVQIDAALEAGYVDLAGQLRGRVQEELFQSHRDNWFNHAADCA